MGQEGRQQGTARDRGRSASAWSRPAPREDPAENLARTLDRIGAGRRGAAPSSSASRSSSAPAYFCQDGGRRALRARRGRSPARAPTRAAAVAARHGVVVVASPLRAPGARALPQHRRRHRRRRHARRALPEDAHPGRPALLREVLLRAGGPRASAPSTPASGRIGVLVCWDQWYPEAARLTALARRADPLLPDGHRHWTGEGGRTAPRSTTPGAPIQRGHAIANGVFVAAVNRVGPRGRRSEFWGGSFVARPVRGAPRRGAGDGEEILVVDCDLARIERGAALALPARPPHRRLRRPHASATARSTRGEATAAARRKKSPPGGRQAELDGDGPAARGPPRDRHPPPRREQGFRWPARVGAPRGDAPLVAPRPRHLPRIPAVVRMLRRVIAALSARGARRRAS